jgi:hypothetical protein
VENGVENGVDRKKGLNEVQIEVQIKPKKQA